MFFTTDNPYDITALFCRPRYDQHVIEFGREQYRHQIAASVARGNSALDAELAKMIAERR